MKQALAFLLTLTLVVSLWGRVVADVPIQPAPFNITANGTYYIMDVQGATSASLQVTTAPSAATVTVEGSPDFHGPSGHYSTNTNFGTSGVITNPATGAPYVGNVQAFPHGFALVVTGLTGTFAGTVTPTGASSSAGSSGGTQNVQCVTPCAVTTPAPAATAANGGINIAPGLCTGTLAFCSPPVGDTLLSSAVTTTLTQVVAAPATGSIRITSIQALGEESATGGFMELEYGTGTNCAIGTTLLAVILYLNTTAGAAQQMSWGTGFGSILILPAQKALCVVISGGTVTAAQISGTYTIW